MFVPSASLLFVCPAALLLCHAAAHDVIARTIPNTDCAALAVLGLLDRLLHRQLLLAALTAGGVLLLCHALWTRRLIGGGDVKLLAACCCLISPAAVPSLLASVLCAGGVLGLGYLLAGTVLRRHALQPSTVPPGRMPHAADYGLVRAVLAGVRRREAWRLRRGAALPYGVAIAAAALLTVTGA